MIDVVEVQVLDGRGNLENIQHSLGLVHLCLLDDLVEQLPALCQLQHNEQEIEHADHILTAYDAWVVHQLKDPYLVQNVGGPIAAVAAVEGCDNSALKVDLDCNPVQVCHHKAQLISQQAPFPTPCSLCTWWSTREVSCQRWPP